MNKMIMNSKSEGVAIVYSNSKNKPSNNRNKETKKDRMVYV